ncbi:hypothetical protein PNOK_0320300 [Pyrrhoderma noxium]|uniref:Uncharacterized protein n=1 Tax=Pyrrhoderma noxium TaxID=2282107 RepID=A0A286ULT0_9AGAM|nr:hypothetical protein PNOK_0320300 [Pyrrhoderma noxium]
MRTYAHKRSFNTPTIENGLKEKLDSFSPDYNQDHLALNSKLRNVTSKTRYHVSQTFTSSRTKSTHVLVIILSTALTVMIICNLYFFSVNTQTDIIKTNSSTNDQFLHMLYFNSNNENSLPAIKYRVDSAKYLAYLPHSGFHNQRIALENALVMARVLNRTLLVPPVRLGRTITYYPFDHLYDLNSLSGKDGLGHCADTSLWKTLPIECSDYYEYTMVPWGWLSNTSSLFSEQPVIERWNMSDIWLHDALGIPENDTFFIKDKGPYDYRYVDADPLDMPGVRFKKVISMALLSQLPHRLIHVGTLFASNRLRLRRPQNLIFRKEVRQSMAFANNILNDLSDSIGTKMGGKYVSVHIRIGDGNFERKSEKNVRLIWWKLMTEVLDLDELTVQKIENDVTGLTYSSPPSTFHEEEKIREPSDLPQISLTGKASTQLTCRQQLHRDTKLAILNVPLYISTDVRNPSSHPLLKRFYDTFPCTFTFNDFPQEGGSLSLLKSSYDGLPMKNFLLPFVDAVVSGRALSVVGTEGSTFSQFVQDILWRQYHGLEIVERG